MSNVQPDTAGLRIEYLPLDKVKRFDRNPKKHDVGALVTSIQRYGFRDAPIFDGTLGALVAGHGRLKALDELRKQKANPPRGIQTGDKGEWLVPVQLGVDAASAVEAQAFLVDHNALTVAGGDMGVEGILRLYDQDGLGAMLKEMAEAGEMPVTLDGDDLDALLGTENPALDAEPQIDRAAELQKKWGTARGQLWALGEHRLLCGDSTKAQDVARLMDGAKATICQTDPPYGIAYVSNAQSKGQAMAHAEIENDELDGEKLQAFLESMIRAALPWLVDNCAFYFWHPMLTQGTFFAAAAAAAADILIHRQIIWCKPSLVFGRGDYHWQHELCFYGWRRGHRPEFYGERNQTTLWNIGRETSKDHPTAKPIALWEAPIKNHTRHGDVAYEPFSGSGSPIIAAEQLGRKCRAIEIDPGYVAVTLQRWADATGKTPELVK